MSFVLFNPISTHVAAAVAGIVFCWFFLRRNPKYLRIDLAAAAAAVKQAALNPK